MPRIARYPRQRTKPTISIHAGDHCHCTTRRYQLPKTYSWDPPRRRPAYCIGPLSKNTDLARDQYISRSQFATIGGASLYCPNPVAPNVTRIRSGSNYSRERPLCFNTRKQGGLVSMDRMDGRLDRERSLPAVLKAKIAVRIGINPRENSRPGFLQGPTVWIPRTDKFECKSKATHSVKGRRTALSFSRNLPHNVTKICVAMHLRLQLLPYKAKS